MERLQEEKKSPIALQEEEERPCVEIRKGLLRGNISLRLLFLLLLLESV